MAARAMVRARRRSPWRFEGARYFLYGEDGQHKSHFDPWKTPERIFIQMEQFRWSD